ncbi:MAG: hypothetical protein JWO82_1150, partial [Akkermansiaceae bacterium]|nr:hypothetical protein [Akkermansiaceae bacterium]
MNRARHAALILALSAATAWAGHALAARRATTEAALSAKPADLAATRSRETSAATTNPAAAANDQARAIARCDTADLWKSLQGTPNLPDWFADDVIRELMDRQGIQAVRQALQISDAAACSRLSGRFLNAYFNKDPWAALDLYLAERGRFDPSWAGEGLIAVNKAAAAISAEKLIEVQKATAGTTSKWVSSLEYPADFDFRTA